MKQASEAKIKTKNAEEEEKIKLSRQEDYMTEKTITWDSVPESSWDTNPSGRLSLKAGKLNGYYNIIIPSKVEETTIKSVSDIWGNGDFNLPEDVKSIKISEGITQIGASAFRNLKKLEYLYLPQSLEEINWRGFSGDSSLKKVTIPSNVKFISMEAFLNCRNLENVYIESTKFETINKIGSDAFKGLKAGSTIYVKNEIIASYLEGKYTPENTTISTYYDW